MRKLRPAGRTRPDGNYYPARGAGEFAHTFFLTYMIYLQFLKQFNNAFLHWNISLFQATVADMCVKLGL
jgi:hypothetical protein